MKTDPQLLEAGIEKITELIGESWLHQSTRKRFQLLGTASNHVFPSVLEAFA
jgi:hypothetical protein